MGRKLYVQLNSESGKRNERAATDDRACAVCAVIHLICV